MYNLIKRALVTVDDSEKVILSEKKENEDISKDEAGKPDKIKEKEREAISQEVALAREKARVIIEDANAEAKKIIEQARQVESELKQSYENMKSELEKTHQNEIKKAQDEFTKSKNDLISSVGLLMDKMKNEKEEYIELTIRQLTYLIRLVVQKVIFIVLSDREVESIENKVRSLVNKTIDYKNVIFYFNPEDMKIIPQDVFDSIKKVLPDAEIRHSPMLKRGDIKIDSDYGAFDGSVEGQMDLLDSIVTDVFQTGEI